MMSCLVGSVLFRGEDVGRTGPHGVAHRRGHAVGPLSTEIVLEMCHKTRRRREGQLRKPRNTTQWQSKADIQNPPSGKLLLQG